MCRCRYRAVGTEGNFLWTLLSHDTCTTVHCRAMIRVQQYKVPGTIDVLAQRQPPPPLLRTRSHVQGTFDLYIRRQPPPYLLRPRSHASWSNSPTKYRCNGCHNGWSTKCNGRHAPQAAWRWTWRRRTSCPPPRCLRPQCCSSRWSWR